MITTNKNCEECDNCGGNAAQVMPPQNENNCPEPNPCTSVTDSRCVYHLGSNVLCGTDIIINTEDTQDDINRSIITYLCEKFQELSGAKIVLLTYVESQALVAGNDVEVGAKYYITDRDIMITGIATNLFSVEGQRIMRVVKHAYYIPTAPSIGVWYSTISPTTDDVVIWGGKCWLSLTGAVGTATNNRTLDATNWQLIPTTNTTYYESRSFFVHYDHANDWVAKQYDWKDNEFGMSWVNADDLGFTYNPVDISDWGSNFVFENVAAGVFNNTYFVYSNRISYLIYENYVVIGNTNEGTIFSNTASVTENNNVGEILENTNSGQVLRNSNLGDISSNDCNGDVSFNSNIGIIEGNSNDGDVSYNNNNGGIIQNANIGDISFNSHNGNILLNTNAVNFIIYNKNSGDIRNNSCSSSISYNSNRGWIKDNSNDGVISYNDNNGEIFSNANTGQITHNSNNGDITGIGATTTDITKNINNGVIATTVVGPISDTTVDK